jgi:nicotinate-nucleotide pyrophosphorylase
MTKEIRDKISNLQTNNSHVRLRLREITVELENLRKLRKTVSVYLDAIMVNEPTEDLLKLMKYFVRIIQKPSEQALKRTKGRVGRQITNP